MNIIILKQEKQPLLSRTEVSAKVSFKGSTPSKKDVQKNIASKLKQKEELTAIKHIYNEFGAQEAEVEAFIYEDKKVMSVLEKSKKKEEKPSEASSETPTAVQAEKPAEQPVEEKAEKQEEEKKEEPVKGEETKEKDKAEEKPEQSEKKSDEKQEEAPKEGESE